MVNQLSVVINTWNEKDNLPRAIKSVKSLASEIIVVDMESTDGTPELAKKLGAKVFHHPPIGYVEPARNIAIGKAQGPWLLILDADEEIPPDLASEVTRIIQEDCADYVWLPRKNIIFSKWIQHSRWWPDFNLRLFKKGHVSWTDQIHSPPKAQGRQLYLSDQESLAIIHYHYQSIGQYISRLNRYTDHQVPLLHSQNYQFHWSDLITKPTSEFLSRFFAGQGYKDGIHGLVLSLLQSISEFVLYLKMWEKSGFTESSVSLNELNKVTARTFHEYLWWLSKSQSDQGQKLAAFKSKLLSKINRP